MCSIEFNEANIDIMDGFWNDILKNYKEGEEGQFDVKITSRNYDKENVIVVLQKADIYVIGRKKEVEDEVERFYQTSYVGVKPYKEISRSRIDSLCSGLKKDISQISLQDIDLAAFIISEAARFDFIRAAIKRLYGANEQKLKGSFVNWTNSEYKYKKLADFKLLTNNYGKIKEFANKNSKMKSKCISILDTQTYFYEDMRKGLTDKEYYDGLIRIGLLEENKVDENYGICKPKKDIITAKQ